MYRLSVWGSHAKSFPLGAGENLLIFGIKQVQSLCFRDESQRVERSGFSCKVISHGGWFKLLTCRVKKKVNRSEAEFDLFWRGVAEDSKDTRACVENNLLAS